MRAGLTDEDISLIYDTVVDHKLWPRLLERLADAVGGGTTSITVRDLRTERTEGFYVRTDVKVFNQYAAYPYNSNPLNSSSWAPVGHFLTDEDQIARPALMRTDYYQNFLHPSDIGPILTGAMRRSPATRWTMNFTRPLNAEPFGPAERDFARRLSPHLVRVAAVSERLEHAEIAARTAEAALDQLPSGIILLDSRGRIAFSNREAQAIAATRDGIAFAAVGLVAARSDDTANLAAAIGRAAERPGRGATLRLARPSGGRALAVLIVPLRDETSWIGHQLLRVLVVVTDPQRGHFPPEQRLEQLYGLTPTEAALALQLLEGNDIAEIAERRRISVSTARLHLHRILQKSGTSRQAELVTLMMRESLGVQ